MIKKTITYVDFNGAKKTIEHRFHLTPSEVLKWETETATLNEDGQGYSGGMSEIMQRIASSREIGKIVEMLEVVIDKAYGVLSDDGESFEKSAESLSRFKSHASYDNFFMSLLENEGKAAADFMNGLIPSDIADQAKNSDRPDPNWRPQAPQANLTISPEQERYDFEAWKRSQGSTKGNSSERG